MSGDYESLLDATIRHLEDLKAHGTRFVSVDQELLAALSRPQNRRLAASSARTAQPFSRPASPGQTATPASRPALVPTRQDSPLEPTAPVTSSPMTREAKEEAMAALRERALVCVKCPNLAAARKNVVFGVGNIHSPLMFVGEAPGADEDLQGEPFVGAAGQLLTKIIQTMGLSRQTVYIANILKCRPDTPGQRSGNRKPTPDEMKTCIPYLLSQVDIIQPRVMVALGATAVEGLLNIKGGITRLRGNWQHFRGIPVMPTYHPAYLLRNQSLAEKRKVWEDMLAVMERLEMPISEKQQGYFLRSG